MLSSFISFCIFFNVLHVSFDLTDDINYGFAQCYRNSSQSGLTDAEEILLTNLESNHEEDRDEQLRTLQRDHNLTCEGKLYLYLRRLSNQGGFDEGEFLNCLRSIMVRCNNGYEDMIGKTETEIRRLVHRRTIPEVALHDSFMSRLN